MHKVWLINIEELVSPKDILYENMYIEEMVKNNLARYVIYLNPGDLFILPFGICPDFADYISRISNLPPYKEWLIELPKHSKPYFMVDSIFENNEVFNKLKNFGKLGNYILEPYIQTPKIVKLSNKTRIPLSKTDPNLINKGLIDKLNHKGYFTEISKDLGIETVPGYYAESSIDLIKNIKKVSLENNNRIILRKAQYAGGAGNMSGEADKLIKKVPQWYNTGGIKIEHFLDLYSTCGSLVEINDKDCKFLGIDKQIIEKGRWAGFTFPYNNKEISGKIKKYSLMYADKIQKMGARGYLNPDWGIVKDKNGHFKLYALEINFRHNGLSCIIELVKRCFNYDSDNIYLSFYGHFKISKDNLSFKNFINSLKNIYIDNKPALIEKGENKKEGIMVVCPLIKNYAGLLLLGKSPHYIEKLKEKLRILK